MAVVAPVVTLITCTGSRPEAFALCEKYMARQTYKGPIQWIVIDDALPETKCTLGQEYYRGPALYREKLNTQRGNMEMALGLVRGKYLFVIEDDDYYPKNYLEAMLSTLKYVAAVGDGTTKYFNISIPGHRTWANFKHSPLAATAMDVRYLPYLKEAVDSGEKYFDIYLWKLLEKNKVPRMIINDSPLFVGMKGLPGRKGIGAGHDTKDYFYDRGFVKLREWLGADAEEYIKLKEKLKVAA